MTTEQEREAYLNEPGTMPPCPFCQRPRVQRSDYVRCNPCGINWLDGEDLNRNPKAERWEKFLAAARSTRSTSSSATETSSGAPTVSGPTR
jgi:ribosomal protein L37AE/L43A